MRRWDKRILSNTRVKGGLLTVVARSVGSCDIDVKLMIGQL
jgi:hypothetical protein